MENLRFYCGGVLRRKIPCTSQCLLTSFFVLAFYMAIKLLYISNSAQVVSETSPHQAFKLYNKFQHHVTISGANATPECHSEYLDGMPNYLKETGCTSDACKRITCRALLSAADRGVYDVARKLMEKHPRTISRDDTLTTRTTDCVKFKRSRGYSMNITEEGDSDFSIAFSILVHSNSEQLERLLRSIYRTQNIYCIHVDQKSSSELRSAVESLSRCFDNVFLASQSVRVTYAGITRLQADLNCMNDLLAHPKRPQWKYLLNVAAQSFPLQTPEDMVRILRIYNGSNDIEGIYGRRILRNRFEEEWVEHLDTNSVNRTGYRNPPPPDDIDIVRGSAYGVFSRPFVEFILNSRMARNLFEWSRKTFSPDEHYWATLNHLYSNPHLHTPGGYSGPPEDKPWLAVFVKWGTPSGCHGKFVRAVCIFGVEDLPDLVGRKEFFTNKFYEDYQPLALDCMEAWINHKTICPVPFDYNFYRSLPFVRT